ncbi:hypothetical protein NKG05_12735 [Oerskovia sp. M15]
MLLIEPMERRCVWLNEVVAELELQNVEVKRGVRRSTTAPSSLGR